MSAAGSVSLAREGAVATLTLAHPGRLNAITVAMWADLRRHFEAFAGDESVRVVVIRGADGQFAAGADISEFPEVRGTEVKVRQYHDELAATLKTIGDCDAVVIARIEGVCVGGGLEIAAMCDLRLAAAGSRFGAPIAKLGFPMAPGELLGLMRLAGPAVAAELLLENRILSAEEAFAKGLVTRVVAAAELDRELAATIARTLAGRPNAVRWNKRLIRRFASGRTDLSEPELAEFFAYAETPEHREGIAEFLKR